MSIKDLAIKLDKVMREIDYYEYVNSDYSVEQAEKDIQECPEDVISTLLDYLEER